MIGLAKYKAKRDLKATKEPSAKKKKGKSDKLIFVIQEHHARHLHFDLRLEACGVLKSWAVPKEPSLDPSVKRLAIHVEDHPYSYKDFEGVIPSGYGKGTVRIWDKGTYTVKGQSAKESEKSIKEGLKKGAFHFTLEGKKLKGEFILVRLKNSNKDEWLLMKKKEAASSKNKIRKAELTHLDKLYWPKEKISKGDLINYYDEISPYLLPYLKDRPESLKRSPNGIAGQTFFQKNLVDTPEWVKTIAVKHKDSKVNYLLIQNQESLRFAVNKGCIELHPFFSRTSALDNPDYLIIDLDPKGASFDKVILVAQTTHELLQELKIPSYCKTSGATGLHIAIPLGSKYTYSQAKAFAEIIALLVHRRIPKISTLERSLSKRKNKVYIDVNQNNFGQTIAAPYSARAMPGATVSTPLKWSEVKKGLDPADFTIKNVLKRVKKIGDIYLPVLKKGINIELVIKRIKAL